MIYKTIKQEGKDEIIITRSRFIGRAKPVVSENEAVSYLESIRKEHWDANHNVWAYILGTKIERYSDDGEPKGTAGIPVLDVVRKEGLRDVIVIVTRYFGGTKLGAGGLVRAYTQGAKIALDAGIIIERRPYHTFDITTDYQLSGKVKREFENKGYILKDTVYLENVTQKIIIAPEEKDSMYALVAELTAGKSIPVEGEVVYLDF